MAQEKTYATGRRKTATARVWLTPGSGQLAVNKMEPAEYFGNIYFEPKIAKPFAVTETAARYDVSCASSGSSRNSVRNASAAPISSQRTQGASVVPARARREVVVVIALMPASPRGASARPAAH